MQFKASKKQITFGFGCQGYEADLYREIVGHCHSGVDWTTGRYGGPVATDNAGYVYKVIRAGETPSNWAGVYILAPYYDHHIEISLGHLSEIFVNVGDTVKEDQVIGLEGNKGEVYSGNTQITKEMQDRGDTRGHHVHELYRPVRKVKTKRVGRHYLDILGKHPTQKAGDSYRDDEGYYYEIVYNNDARGAIDPMHFATRKVSDKFTKAATHLSGDPDALVVYKLGQLLKRIGL